MGANIGLASIYFAKNFPKGRIIAIESDKNTFAALERNLNEIPNSICLNKAIWSHPTTLGIVSTFRDHQSWSHSVTENLARDSVDQIDSIDFNTLIKEHNISSIDLLKIDIEGAEGEIFSERANLDFLKIVKVLALEIHEEVSDREHILTVLRKYDFILFEMNETTLAFKRHLIVGNR